MFKTRTGIDSVSGKEKFTTQRGFKTKKEAQLAANKLEKEVRSGSYVKEQEILFKDFAKEWLSLYGKVSKISSVRAREKQTDRLMDYFSNVKTKSITKLMYQNAINDLHEKGYAPNTLDGIHSAGRMLFKQAVEFQIIKNDPTTNIVLPKQVETVEELEKKKEEIKYLEKEELSCFLMVAKEKGLENDYVLFSVLAYSGMRAGELLALKWSDIDFH